MLVIFSYESVCIIYMSSSKLKNVSLDVHLPNLIIKICHNEQKNSYRLKHDDWWKHFLIINFLFLSKFFCHQSRFISLYQTIKTSFPPIDSLTGNGFNNDRWLHKFLDMIRIHRLHLNFHSILPIFLIFVRNGLVVVTKIQIMFIRYSLSYEHESIKRPDNPLIMIWL